MTIPIRNIYYLLAYAWDIPPIGKLSWTSRLDAQNEVQLLARVLNRGIEELLRVGFDREYIEIAEDIKGIRGKVVFAETIKRQLFAICQTHCRLDQLSEDVLQNQILKATIQTLLSLDPAYFGRGANIRKELVAHLATFKGVRNIQIQPRMFDSVRIHRNNQHYRLLMHVCRFIHESRVLEDRFGGFRFRAFESDKLLEKVFEKFVFNFYKRESNYEVKRDHFRWQAVSGDSMAMSFLPMMKTDAVLRRGSHTIVIDTKFYADMFRDSGFGQAKLNSSHVYQMFSYLQNLAVIEKKKMSGMLLYPTVRTDKLLQYELHGHRLTVATVDLDQDWATIHQRLCSLVEQDDRILEGRMQKVDPH